MPEIKLVSERTGIMNGINVVKKKYLIDDNYDIRHEILGEDSHYISIKVTKRDRYIPQIYVDEDIIDDEIYGFVIQTTSYGSLDKKEIENMIQGYQYALQVIDLLEKEFYSALTKRPESK